MNDFVQEFQLQKPDDAYSPSDEKTWSYLSQHCHITCTRNEAPSLDHSQLTIPIKIKILRLKSCKPVPKQGSKIST